MSYVLRKAVLDRVPSVKITKEEFQALATAQRSLKHAFAIEERFDNFVSSYLSLEKRLVGIESHYTIRASSSYRDLYELQSGLNARMVAFLNSARLYQEHLFTHVRRCVPKNAHVVDRLRAMLDNERDRHFEYRFIEALRDYVNNHGMPVHHVSHRTKSWQSISNETVEFSLDTFVRREVLGATGGFSTVVLDEMPDTVNLKVACRRYVDSINSINTYTRRSFEEVLSESRECIDRAYSTYHRVYPANPIGLCAMNTVNGVPQSSLALAREWDVVREELVAKNTKVFGLRRHLATGREWIMSTSPEARIAHAEPQVG